MESHFLKAFDSELLSSKKTSIFVIWVPFRLHWKWKGLLSDLLCHQFSLFNPSCCGLLYILISCTVHLMEYFFDLLSSFPRSYLTMLVLKSLCPFLPCLLCCYALPLVVFLFCGSPLAPPSSLCITSLSYPSLSSPLNSNPLIFRGLLDNRTKIFRVTLTSPVPCIVPGVVSTNKYLLNELIKCISFPFKPASFSNFHLLSLVSLFLSLSTTANIWFFSSEICYICVSSFHCVFMTFTLRQAFITSCQDYSHSFSSGLFDSNLSSLQAVSTVAALLTC